MKKFGIYFGLILSLIITRVYIPMSISPLFVLLFISAADIVSLSAVLGLNLAIDVLLGSFNLPIMVSVYVSYFVGVYLVNQLSSTKFISSSSSVAADIVSALTLPTVHFIITNFISWLQMSNTSNPTWYIYSHNIVGLFTCYVASLSFYLNQLISTVLWLSVYYVSTVKSFSLKDSFSLRSSLL